MLKFKRKFRGLKVKNDWNYACTPPFCLYGVARDSLTPFCVKCWELWLLYVLAALRNWALVWRCAVFVLQLIFSGEYTKAMSKDWHSGHFCCWQCDESLTGQRYVLRDDHPYCIKCYESVFANVCEECNKTIGIDSKVRQWVHMEVKLHGFVLR